MTQREIDKLAAVVAESARNIRIVAAYLHGSHARDQAGPFSDVDVAVLLAAPPTEEPLRLELVLTADINRALAIDAADVRILNNAPLVFQGQVLTHGRLIFCQDAPARVEFECRVRGEYFDFLPVLEEIIDARLERIARVGLHG